MIHMNKADQTALSFILRLLTPFLKFLFVYQIFGTFALEFAILCVGINDFLFGNAGLIQSLLNENADAWVVFSRWVTELLDCIPFHELFDLLVEDHGGVFSQIADLFVSLGNGKFQLALTEYLPLLFKDIARASLAALAFFALSRLNRFLIPFSGKDVDFAFGIVCVFWTFGSYCFSNLCLSVLEDFVSPQHQKLAYLLVFLFSFALHVIFLSRSLFLSSKKSTLYTAKVLKNAHDIRGLRVFIILLIDVVFQFINTFLIWQIGSRLLHIYTPIPSYELFFRSVLSVLIALFLLYLSELLKKFVQEILTLPLYNFFYNKSVKNHGLGKRGFRF